MNLDSYDSLDYQIIEEGVPLGGYYVLNYIAPKLHVEVLNPSLLEHDCIGSRTFIEVIKLNKAINPI